MSSPAPAPRAPVPHTKAAARVPIALPPQAGAPAAANDDAEMDLEQGASSPNPLWVIAIAMAVFFGVAALVMAAG